MGVPPMSLPAGQAGSTGVSPVSGMGILPMSRTGILPVCIGLASAGTALGRMAKMAMPRLCRVLFSLGACQDPLRRI